MMPRAAVVLLALSGCASSAALAREGRYAEACVVARDEEAEEQDELRERLFAAAAPRMAFELIGGDELAALQAALGNLHPDVRFARGKMAFEDEGDLAAHAHLVRLRGSDAAYHVGVLNEFVASQLVLSKPEEGIPELLWTFGRIVNAMLFLGCAGLTRDPHCGDHLDGSDEESMRQTIDQVSRDPALRSARTRLLAAYDHEGGWDTVYVLYPENPSVEERATLEIELHTRLRNDDETCAYAESVVATLRHATLARSLPDAFSADLRPLRPLRPKLEAVYQPLPCGE
jgi:hypothetical protein